MKRAPPSRPLPPIGYVERSERTRIIRIWYEPPPMSLLEKAKTMSNDPRQPDFAEATRLTQAGRLQEATALIQRLLRGEGPAPAEPAARTIDAVAETIEVTDRPAAAAPTPEAGGWQMPAGLRDLVGK